MPASNVIVGDRTIEAIVADMAAAAAFISEHDLFDLHRDFASLYREGAELIEELAANVERLRKFEEYDKRLSESARRERERGDDGMDPST
jgi:isochorismate hydrolase